MSINKTELALVLIIIILGGVAAYGWTRPAGVVTGTPIYTSLVDQAKKEGKLVIYSCTDSADMEKELSVFKQLYPWAAVESTTICTDMVSKSITEYKAGQVKADVAEMAIIPLIPIISAGAVEPVKLDMENSYPAEYQDANHLYHVTGIRPVVLIYNKNLINDPTTLPKTWEDLANPIWKGKLATAKPSAFFGFGELLMTLKPTMTDSAWRSFMQKLAAQDFRYTSSLSEAYTLVASGEVEMMVGQLHDAINGEEQGDPVGHVWPAPMSPATVIGMLLLKNAPHPAMARLFMEWYISWSGQEAIAATGRMVASKGVFDKYFPSFIPSDKTVVWSGSGVPDLYTTPEKYTAIFKEIFGPNA